MGKRKKYKIGDLLIESYAAEGKCIGRHEQKVIFVEGVVPGDRVNVFVTKNKKDWAEAVVQEIVNYSPERVQPFCTHFGVCGGCKWQMLPYQLQLQYKEQQVKDQFKRIGRIEAMKYLPIKGCDDTVFYRNKLEFTFSNKQYLDRQTLLTGVTFDRNVLGFHAPRLFDKVIDIDTCYLQHDPSNQVKNFLRALALEKGYTFYDIREHTGLLRNLMIRVSSTREVLVNLVFGEDQPETVRCIMEELKNNFPTITSLNYTLNRKMNDSIYDQEVICFSGKDHIEEKLENFRFKISPKSFFQTNPVQAAVLYNIVKEFADLKGHETLYDLYCGTGSIGIFLSGNVKKIIGVDTVEDAIADAKVNSEMNALSNTFFYSGDVIKICNDEFFSKNSKPDIVIVDPPRMGCHPDLLEKLLQIGAPKIVYVSCNPATQARDLNILSAQYEIVRSQAVDMFPHTHHVENVVLLHHKIQPAG